MPTPWRKLSYEYLSGLELSGKVLDLGGSRKSGYHELLQGNHTIEVVNMDENSGFDKNFDLEKPFPLSNENYNAVLACNVLEHIFNYQNIFSETHRILKQDGVFVITVPFFMFIHPSPDDHWRYTKETLMRLLTEAGFKDVDVTPLGRGPGAVFVQVVGGVRGGRIWRIITSPFMWIFDKMLSLYMSQVELRERFPLGYFVVAKKKV